MDRTMFLLHRVRFLGLPTTDIEAARHDITEDSADWTETFGLLARRLHCLAVRATKGAGDCLLASRQWLLASRAYQASSFGTRVERGEKEALAAYSSTRRKAIQCFANAVRVHPELCSAVLIP